MSYHPTQFPRHAQKPGSLDETIIDLRRRRQRRGREVLSEGCVVAYLPHEGFAIRVTAGNEASLADEITLDVAAAPGPLPHSFVTCTELPWEPIGWIRYRWIMPTFWWETGVNPWFANADDVAAKGFAAYHHVHKGYELNPEDGIIANPAPVWTIPELEAT
jgi:hypothetical protein